jgi:hypothetical protein
MDSASYRHPAASCYIAAGRLQRASRASSAAPGPLAQHCPGQQLGVSSYVVVRRGCVDRLAGIIALLHNDLQTAVIDVHIAGPCFGPPLSLLKGGASGFASNQP